MAFKISYMQSGDMPAYEDQTFNGGIALKAGLLLKMKPVTVSGTSYNLVDVCGASEKPDYVCVVDGVTSVLNEKYLVQPIVDTAVYETTASADSAASLAGKIVTTASGLQITATPVTPAKAGAYGATVITDTAFTSGDRVLVKFEDKPQTPTA